MSSVSVVSNSSVEVESDSSSEEASKDEHKFVLPNELYKSLLASAVLGKTVLNRNLSFKDNLSSFKGNLSALDSALKELKDIKGLTVSSVPAFPRNLALRREDQDEKASFAWSEGGEEGGGGGGGGGGSSGGAGSGGGGGTGTSGAGSGAGSGSGGLAHWVSVMAEHIHNPHSASGVAGVHHQQQSPPQAPYPWNNGLSSDQCNPHDKESDYWGGARGAKQGYEIGLLLDNMDLEAHKKLILLNTQAMELFC